MRRPNERGEADLTVLRLIHRSLRDDLHRLTELISGLADTVEASAVPPIPTVVADTGTDSWTTPSGGGEGSGSRSYRLGAFELRIPGGHPDVALMSRRRAEAVRDYVTLLCEEMDRHHDCAARILWPLVAESAGAALDTRPYRETHELLTPILAGLRAAADQFTAAPESGAALLAALLRVVRDRVDEHVHHLEQDVLPIIERYVSAKDYAVASRRMRSTISLDRVPLVLPWAARLATREERRRLMRETGIGRRLLRVLSARAYVRLERRVFGPIAR
ncbi:MULTISPECIES: hemerythrin domain-containing protein [unclassified Nonomuraea]|uniref:hemerythrin domain-containing protein n=1 Tax=unclassified Nonomuraea TaxID=2593643 RepID=UPI0033D6A096